MAERNGVDRSRIVIGAVVVSNDLRRTIVRQYRRRGRMHVDLAARIDAEYDVESVAIDDLQERFRQGDRIEPPASTLLPDVPEQLEISDQARRLLIEAAVRAIGTAFFVGEDLACEILDVCQNLTALGDEPRIVLSCHPIDFSAPVGMMLDACGDMEFPEQIESISVESWINLMVATDWTTLPMSPGCGDTLSENEAEEFLQRLFRDSDYGGIRSPWCDPMRQGNLG